MDRIIRFIYSPLGKRILIAVALFLISLRLDIFLVFIPFVFLPWKKQR